MRSACVERLRNTLITACLVSMAASGTGRLLADERSAPAPPPCSGPEWRQFDFWIGDWDATWEGGRGRNRVTATLGRCVVLEQFDASGSGGDGLEGMSVSTYDPQQRAWRQTWVDNSGAYLDFVGGLEGDRMILSRQAEREGRRFLQRMVWQNITADAFDWRWERSDEGGKAWTTVWAIRYRRR